MSTVKIAFAGFRHGHIFDLYTRVKKDSSFTITAAYENSPEGLKDMEAAGIAATHSDFDLFLAQADADIIAIGDYYAARGAEIIKALKAHKHVISDKPLCVTECELDEIEGLCKANSLSVLMLLDLRYGGQYIAAREIIKSGRLGEIKNIQFNGTHSIDYANRPHWYFEKGKHGGTINDLAVHGIDLVRYMTGLEFSEAVAAVQTNAYAHKNPDFKDSAAFIYTLENGALVTADTSYCTPERLGFTVPQYWRFNIWGTKGAAELCAASNDVTLYFTGKSEPEIITRQNAKNDALDDIITEINGGRGILSTEDTLRAARITLTLGQLANK